MVKISRKPEARFCLQTDLAVRHGVDKWGGTLTIDNHWIVVLILLGEYSPLGTHGPHLLSRCKCNPPLNQLEHGLLGLHRQLVILVATEGFVSEKFLYWTWQDVVITNSFNTVDLRMAVKPERPKSEISSIRRIRSPHPHTISLRGDYNRRNLYDRS